MAEKFNQHAWLRKLSAGTLTEAPMDKEFKKEFERNCTILLRHLEHEAKTAKGADKSTISKMIQTLRTVKGYPDLMGKMFGLK
tara:strand:+ start:99 stop:347 length:249 start_codon:yes stop_codon:yes gene_type:complete